jgi:hypothetical protein
MKCSAISWRNWYWGYNWRYNGGFSNFLFCGLWGAFKSLDCKHKPVIASV